MVVAFLKLLAGIALGLFAGGFAVGLIVGVLSLFGIMLPAPVIGVASPVGGLIGAAAVGKKVMG